MDVQSEATAGQRLERNREGRAKSSKSRKGQSYELQVGAMAMQSKATQI
jgi:hypothetical protein